MHSAPIDNRWNKKLEFVYSLVTQIRAATLLSYPLLPSSPFHVLQHQRPFSSIASSSWIPTSSLRCHRHGHQHQRDNTNANVNPPLPPPPPFASRYFIFPHFSLRRFVPSDEFAHPAPECICQTLKQIGRQLTNTSASVTSTT